MVRLSQYHHLCDLLGCVCRESVILYQSICDDLQSGYGACRKIALFTDNKKFLNRLGTYKFYKVPLMLHTLNPT
jgi:hypothetical protein